MKSQIKPAKSLKLGKGLSFPPGDLHLKELSIPLNINLPNAFKQRFLPPKN